MKKDKEDRAHSERVLRFRVWWKDYARVLLLALSRVSKDSVSILASGLVYSTLISLIPCIAFLFAIFSAFGVLQTVMAMLTAFLVEVLGEISGMEIINMIETYTGNALSLGIFGVISFLITSILLIDKIYTVMNRIFRTQPSTGTIRRFTTFLTLLIVAALLAVVFITVQGRVERTLQNFVRDDFVLASSSIWEKIMLLGTSWFVIFSMIFFMPNTRVRLSSALVGSVTGLLSVEVSSAVFELVILRSVKYSVIYGSFASIFLALIYLYIFWFIILVAAEIAYVHQFRPDKDLIKGRPESPLSQISMGINLLLFIADNYRSGHGATTENEMVKSLSVPTSKLYGYLNCLEGGGFIMPVNSQRTAFVPAMPLDKIRLIDVLHALYGSERKDGEDIQTMGEAVAAELEEKGIKALKDISIENLMERL